MEFLNQIQKLAFSTQVAVYSFSIGTLLFLLSFVFNNNGYLIITGYVYVIIALLINTLILLWLICNLILLKEQRQETLIKILILLANIPIAFFYLFIVIGTIF
jgi:hypothetical protein